MRRTCRIVNGQPVWEPPFTPEEIKVQCDRFQEMLATGQGPCVLTDAVFLQGHCNGSQFAGQPQVGDLYDAEARAAGVSTKGKVYLSGLAEYPGDPRAWVDGRGDVKRICEERGWDCDGAVTVKSEKAAPAAPIGVAEDLISDEIGRILATVENPAQVDVEDLREQVIEKRKPHWVK